MRDIPIYIALFACAVLLFTVGCGGAKTEFLNSGKSKTTSDDDPPPQYTQNVRWYPMFSGNYKNNRNSISEYLDYEGNVAFFHNLASPVAEAADWGYNFTNSSHFPSGNPFIHSIPVLGEILYIDGDPELCWTEERLYAVDEDSHLLCIDALNGEQMWWEVDIANPNHHKNFSSAAVQAPVTNGYVDESGDHLLPVFVHSLDCDGNYYIYEDNSITPPIVRSSNGTGPFFINEQGEINQSGSPAWKYAIASPVLTCSVLNAMPTPLTWYIPYSASFFAGYHHVNADNLYCCRFHPEEVTGSSYYTQCIEDPVGFSVQDNPSDPYMHIITTPAIEVNGNTTDVYVVTAGLDFSGKVPLPKAVLCRSRFNLTPTTTTPPVPPVTRSNFNKYFDNGSILREFAYYELPDDTNEVPDISHMTLAAPVIQQIHFEKRAYVATPTGIAGIDIDTPGAADDLSVAEFYPTETGRVGSMPVIRAFGYHGPAPGNLALQTTILFFVENDTDYGTGQLRWRMIGYDLDDDTQILWKSEWIYGEHCHSQPIIRTDCESINSPYRIYLWNTSASGLHGWPVVIPDGAYWRLIEAPVEAPTYSYGNYYGDETFASLSSLEPTFLSGNTDDLLLFQANSVGNNGIIRAYALDSYVVPPPSGEEPPNPSLPSIAWPQMGNTLDNQSYQDVATGGNLVNTEIHAIDAGPGNLSQVVVSDNSWVFQTGLNGCLYGISLTSPLGWTYSPPSRQNSFTVTPTWCNPDGIAGNGDERVYYVYQDTSGQIQMCSVHADTGAPEWTVPVGLCNMKLRSSPVVDGDYIYIAQGVQGLGNSITLEAFNRVTGASICDLSFPGMQAACTVTVTHLENILLLCSDHSTSWLKRITFNGAVFTVTDSTSALPGDIVVNDPNLFDTNGPISYGAGGWVLDTYFATFALADRSTNSGGVYAYYEMDLSTPQWTYQVNNATPAFCSGLSFTGDWADLREWIFVYDGSGGSDNPATDTYDGKIVAIHGGLGTQMWSSSDFNGRVGSAITVSDDGYLYCQSRYQGTCSLLCFDTSVNLAPAETLSTPSAGIGPVSLSILGDDPGEPSLFYMDQNGLYGLSRQY